MSIPAESITNCDTKKCVQYLYKLKTIEVQRKDNCIKPDRIRMYIPDKALGNDGPKMW